MPAASLIFQRDQTLLVSAGYGFECVLATVRQCAQLRGIIAGSYLFELSPTALWGSAARGCSSEQIVRSLEQLAAMPMPATIAASITETLSRYGAIEVIDGPTGVQLVVRSTSIFEEIGIQPPRVGSTVRDIDVREVAPIKVSAARAGWPVVDRRRAVLESTPIRLGEDLRLRPYQADALLPFRQGQDGVVLLPCGAGKTIVGIAAAEIAGGPLLVLVPSRVVGEQWQTSFVSLTDIHPDQIDWVGSRSDNAIVATATYHAATSGMAAGAISGRRWRLVIYDEVQTLPADIFRMAAGIDADRRLGLSATLVREDHREPEVFALVGPSLYEASWLELERDGWIAPARCVEVRVPTAPNEVDRLRYKISVVDRILDQHQDDQVLVVGTDVASLRATGRRLDFPVLTGSTSFARRSELFNAFRSRKLNRLGVSRIGSVGIDLPDASVLIQVSGTFGSRQEEAQRLGRILRPADDKTASFYTIVSEGTREPYFAGRRQRFLVNQGYAYEIVDASSLPRSARSAQ